MNSIYRRTVYPKIFFLLIIIISGLISEGRSDEIKNIIKLDTSGKSPLIKNIKIIRQDGGRVNWSSSGNNLIVFDKKNSDGYYDIYTMTSEGEIISNLTDGNSKINQKHNGDPVWHPNGYHIVFKSEEMKHFANSNKWFSDPGIGIFNNLWATTYDGKQFWKLTNIPLKKRLFDGIPAMAVLFPRFSHDGTKLAWSERYDKNRSKDGKKGRWGKWRIKIAEFAVDNGKGPSLKNERVLFQPTTGFYVNIMSFSPDDNKILLVGNPEDQNEYGMDQYIFDLKTEQFVNITNTPDIWEEGSCWSPNGKYIVYMTNIGSPIDFKKEWTKQHTTREYWIMDADGSNKQRLTYFNDPEAPEYIGKPVIVAQCAFSPDGKNLIGILGVDYGDKKKPKIQLKIIKIEFKNNL